MSQLALTNLLSPDRIKIPIVSEDKNSVIEEMCDFLSELVEADEATRSEIREAVFEREAVLSTGVGGQVALPHGRSEALEDLVLVAGSTSSGVDFGSLDEQPVRVVVLLVGPESASDRHIQALSRIGRAMREPALIDALIKAHTPAEFCEALTAAEPR